MQIFSTPGTLQRTGNNRTECLPGVGCLTRARTLFPRTKDLNIQGISFSSTSKLADGCLPCGCCFAVCASWGALTRDVGPGESTRLRNTLSFQGCALQCARAECGTQLGCGRASQLLALPGSGALASMSCCTKCQLSGMLPWPAR